MFESIKIGSLKLKNNLISAPLAGVSSLPYRILAMEMGCSLSISEMVASEGAIRAKLKSEHFFRNDPRIRPFGIQVWGAKPEYIYEVIRMLNDEPVDLFDINMGCPAKKICKKGAGSALMKTPSLAKEIIRSARKATKKPLTVKIRSGWDESFVNCVEIAKIAEGEGVNALTIHPRTRTQEFKGKADWSLIKKVKDEIKIPVIGNGDIKCREDAIRMINETGCDAIMIGRAGVGNPWIFKEILNENYRPPTKLELGGMAIRHLTMLKEFYDSKKAVLIMRKILPWYGKGIPGIKKFLSKANTIKDFEIFVAEINNFFINKAGLDTCL